MAGFIRLFSFQSRTKFWCSLIVNHSETCHMLIGQPLGKDLPNKKYTNKHTKELMTI
jgi:hypothetical protein